MLIATGILLHSVESVPGPLPEQAPFSLWMNEGINAALGKHSLASFLILLFLIVLQSILFGTLAERTQLLYKNTWLPVLFFGLFNLVFTEQTRFNPELWANVFLVLAVMSMFQAQGKERALPALLNAGILSGLAFLFAPSTLMFIPVFIFGIVMFKQVRTLDVFQYLFGYFLVLFTTVTILYLLKMDEVVLAYLSLDYIHPGNWEVWQDPYFTGLIAFLAVILIPTLLRLQQNFFKNTIRVRKLQQFILAYFIVSVLYALLGAQKIQTAIGIMSLPLSIYFTYYFLPDKRKWLKEVVFLLFLCLLVFQHLRPF